MKRSFNCNDRLGSYRRAAARGVLRAFVVGGLLHAVLTGSAMADLRGFEQNGGYQPATNMVQTYNAGQYGTTNGYGGSPTPITPNSGLWRAIHGGGGPFDANSYVTGHQGFDRRFANGQGGAVLDQGLALTTNHEGWNGPALEYDYSIDTADLDGRTPVSTGSSTIQLSFWLTGQMFGQEFGGQVPNGYFGNSLMFRDSANNIGFSLGLTQRGVSDHVTLWNGSSLMETAIVPSIGGRFDRWDLTFNLVTDTFSADYFKFDTNSLAHLVTNAPLMNAMSNLSFINFRTSPGVNHNKYMAVDDFDFVVQDVPAPGTAALFIAGLAGMVSRRRRAHQ